MPQQCAEPPPRPPPTGAKQGHNPPTTPPPQPDSPGKPPKPHPPNPTHPRGSSPHTRGAPRLVDGVEGKQGIIPAYAGSTSSNTVSCHQAKDHPRIRGEHYSHECELPDSHGSSPHTRGALPDVHGRHRRARIIPAYAGSTRSCPAPPERYRDHPRIRGEHVVQVAPEITADGSSPHTRGALPRRPS